MNILPFVLSFLLLMTLVAGSLLKEVKDLALEKRVVIGEIHATQILLSKTAKKAYDNQKTTTDSPNKDGKKDNTTTPQPIVDSDEKKDGKPRKRYYYCKSEWGKFQLRSILDKAGSATTHPAYDTAIRLIEDLYSHTTFWQEAKDCELARKIVDKLMLWKEGEIAHHFADDPPLFSVFQKMLKGTNTYDIQEKKGYPPFFDFFTLAEGAKGRAVVFIYASYPVLQAAIGKDFLETLKQKEKVDKVLKPDFITLFETHPERKKFPPRLEDFFYFAGITKTTTLAKDSSSEVTTRVKQLSYLNRKPAAASADVR